MKTKLLLVTIIVAVLSAGAYFYITNSKPLNPPIPKFNEKLVGQWTVDSTTNSNDSTNNPNFFTNQFAKNAKVEFKQDSSLNISDSTNESTLNYYLNSDTIFIKKDSVYEINLFKILNDSTVQITQKDGSLISLKKKK